MRSTRRWKGGSGCCSSIPTSWSTPPTRIRRGTVQRAPGSSGSGGCPTRGTSPGRSCTNSCASPPIRASCGARGAHRRPGPSPPPCSPPRGSACSRRRRGTRMSPSRSSASIRVWREICSMMRTRSCSCASMAYAGSARGTRTSIASPTWRSSTLSEPRPALHALRLVPRCRHLQGSGRGGQSARSTAGDVQEPSVISTRGQ